MPIAKTDVRSKQATAREPLDIVRRMAEGNLQVHSDRKGVKSVPNLNVHRFCRRLVARVMSTRNRGRTRAYVWLTHRTKRGVSYSRETCGHSPGRAPNPLFAAIDMALRSPQGPLFWLMLMTCGRVHLSNRLHSSSRQTVRKRGGPYLRLSSATSDFKSTCKAGLSLLQLLSNQG
jgi:hypothetical protein